MSKVKGALIVWRKKVMTQGGDLLAETESGVFYLGEGGFGGDPGQRPKYLTLQTGPSRISQSPILFPKTKQPSIASTVTSILFTSTLILPKGVVFPVPFSTAFVLTATP